MTPAEMVATASARLSGPVAGRHVLVIQDTTSLRDDGRRNSLQLHPAIAVDAVNLGVSAVMNRHNARVMRRMVVTR